MIGKMSEQKIFFIDTNVIVYYLILSKLKERKRLDKKKDIPKYERYGKSYEFIKKIVSLKKDKIKFIISPLSGIEVYSALFDEYRCDKMYEGGIPLTSWGTNRFSVKVTNEGKRDIEQFLQVVARTSCP